MSKAVFIQDTILGVSKRFPTKTNKLKRVLMVYEGKRRSYLRTISQFIKDIENSWLGTFPLPDDESRHPEVLSNPSLQKLMQKLIGGTITCTIEEWKAGEGYVVNEFSSVLHDSSHPMFNKGVKVGDTLKHETDGFRIVSASDNEKLGFCTLMKSDQAVEREENAEAYALQKAANQLGSSFDLGTVVPETRMIEVAEPTYEERVAVLEELINNGTATQRKKAKAELAELTAEVETPEQE